MITPKSISQLYACIMLQTSFVPDKEQYNYSKTQLLALMDVAMGGRVAEELIFGSDMVRYSLTQQPACYIDTRCVLKLVFI